MSSNNVAEFTNALVSRASTYQVELSDDDLAALVQYYELLSHWNDRLHLVAPAQPSEFATRHVLESLMLVNHLPQRARVADIGSGGGLPIIPCLIKRHDVEAKLIESSKKKSVFLREAVTGTGIGNRATVIANRFQDVNTPTANCITSRALEKFTSILPQLIKWAPDDATLFLFGGGQLEEALKTPLDYQRVAIPNSERRFLFIARKQQK